MKPCQGPEWVPPYPCPGPATCRVRLYDFDGLVESEHELDLCYFHADIAAGEYPDNIQIVERY